MVVGRTGDAPAERIQQQMRAHRPDVLRLAEDLEKLLLGRAGDLAVGIKAASPLAAQALVFVSPVDGGGEVPGLLQLGNKLGLGVVLGVAGIVEIVQGLDAALDKGHLVTRSVLRHTTLRLGKVGSHLAGGVLDGLHVTLEQEGTFWDVIVLAVDEGVEVVDGGFKVNELTLEASEDLSDGEGLRHETLHLTGTGNGELVLLGELVHTKDSNNVGERLVVLEDLDNRSCGVVVQVTDDGGVKHTRDGVKRVDSGVDTELGNRTRQHSGGVKVSEGGGGSRIGKIISRHVDSLDGSDGTVLGGGNALLEGTQIGSKSGLVTDSRGNAAKKGRHLRAGLSETEDVVNEEQHILAFGVTEVLSDGKTSQTDTGTGTRGLVHLSVHEGSLGLVGISSEVVHTGLNHLVVQIVTLTGTFTDTGEDRETTVVGGDVVDQLHDNDGLTDTGTTEQTDLTTLGVRGEKVDNLDTRDENLGGVTLVREQRSRSVDGEGLLLSGLVDGSAFVDGVTDDVDDAAEGLATDGDTDGISGVTDLLTTNKTFGGFHGNGTDSLLTHVSGDLKDEALAREGLALKGVQDLGKLAVELDVDNGTNDLGDATDGSGLIGESAHLRGGADAANGRVFQHVKHFGKFVEPLRHKYKKSLSSSKPAKHECVTRHFAS